MPSSGTTRSGHGLLDAWNARGHHSTEVSCKRPQTNGICERFHKTVLDEFYHVAFRKKLYRTVDELQADLDAWVREYNEQRPHQGRWCYGKTPQETFLDSLDLAKEKNRGRIVSIRHSDLNGRRGIAVRSSAKIYRSAHGSVE